MATILCVDVDPSVAGACEAVVHDLGHVLVRAASVDDALEVLALRHVDLICADGALQGRDGRDLLQSIADRGLGVPVVVLFPHASVEHAAAAARLGAADYLTTPLRTESLRIAVSKALDVERLRRENAEAHRVIADLARPRALCGESEAMRDVLSAIGVIAPTHAAVLIQGEPGTGKGVLAREIHERSPRRDHALVTVNCAALSGDEVERVLFGTPRGASGPGEREPGAFDRAAGGTLVLDEIAELGPDVQGRLLRRLLDQRVERPEGALPGVRGVRLIATAGRDLEAEVEAGRLSRELFRRLSVVVVHAPPLRDRIEDIPSLVDHFIARATAEWAVKPPIVPPETIEYLKRRPWPENLRELANAVEHALIFHRGEILAPEDFEQSSAWSGIADGVDPLVARPTSGPVVPAGPAAGNPSGDAETFDLHQIERRMIHRALEFTRGHRAKAAALLGINERTLRNKLKAERAETGDAGVEGRPVRSPSSPSGQGSF